MLFARRAKLILRRLQLGRLPSVGAVFLFKNLVILVLIENWLLIIGISTHAQCDVAAPTLCKQMVSGSISPGSTPYFSPFPHGTSSLWVILYI